MASPGPQPLDRAPVVPAAPSQVRRATPDDGWSRLPALLEMLHYMEPLHRRLMPEPHLYLFVIGVEPAQQRRGLGSLVLGPVLEQCDRERSRAYLETTREENLAFYTRHGFELVQVVERAGWPKFWLMIRPPQR